MKLYDNWFAYHYFSCLRQFPQSSMTELTAAGSMSILASLNILGVLQILKGLFYKRVPLEFSEQQSTAFIILLFGGTFAISWYLCLRPQRHLTALRLFRKLPSKKQKLIMRLGFAHTILTFVLLLIGILMNSDW